MSLVQSLREEGYSIDYSMTPAKSDKQFKRAQELNAVFTVKVERNQEGEVAVRCKHMSSREEKVLNPDEAASTLRQSGRSSNGSGPRGTVPPPNP